MMFGTPNSQWVYISRPIGTSEKLLKEVETLIIEAGGRPYKWAEGTRYPENLIYQAVAIVVIDGLGTDGVGSFRTAKSDMTRGVKTEICTAAQRQIPIFKVYRASDGLKIYAVENSENYFSGISGITSTTALKVLISSNINGIEEKEAEQLLKRQQNNKPEWDTPTNNWASGCSNTIEISKGKFGTVYGVPDLTQTIKEASLIGSSQEMQDWIKQNHNYLTDEEQENILLLII